MRDKPAKYEELVREIATFIQENHSSSTGVIYCLSRRDCENMAAKLRDSYGLKAQHYHAGMGVMEKEEAQADWQRGVCHIIVATVS